MTIDLLTESDLPAALRLSTQAGWNQLEIDWHRLLTLWPETCFAGRVNGQLIATSTLATYATDVGWIGMVLVDEAHRGQGHGGEILDAAIHSARQRGIQTIGLDATDLGRPVYLKRGFRDVAGIDRWVREPIPRGDNTIPHDSRGRKPRISCATDPGLPPSAIMAQREITRLDRDATGLDRAGLLTHLQHEPNVHCSTIHRAASTTAFALLRPGRTASHLGPVVAETETDATAAIEQVLTTPSETNDQSILIDVPRGKLAGWLKSAGFTVARKLTRMCLGPDAPFITSPKVFAACSFEMG